VLSTGLLLAQLVRERPQRLTDGVYRTAVDRVLAPTGAAPGAA
jgi:hypothetical protein